MRKLTILLCISAFLLSSCGESHTYSGVLKRTGLSGSEGKVKITIQKNSEEEGTMTIKSDGDNNPSLFLTECLYGIKISKSKAPGDASWNPVVCGLKGKFGEEIISFLGDIEFDNQKMKMKTTATNPTGDESRFEFEGTVK